MSVKRVHPKDKFTPEEDEKLRNIVMNSKVIDWKRIATKMGNRNPRQCKDRWTKYLNPSVNTEQFSVEEDLMLLHLYDVYGAKWVYISKFFYNRSDVSIKSRFMVLKRRGVTREFLQKGSLILQDNQAKSFVPEQNEMPNSLSIVSPNIVEEFSSPEPTFPNSPLEETFSSNLFNDTIDDDIFSLEY